jgi:ferrous iron transport protein B
VRELGVPVIPVVGHKRHGIKELKDAIAKAKVAPLPDFPLPEAMKEELIIVGGGLAILDVGAAGQFSQPHAARSPQGSKPSLNSAVAPRAWICQEGDGMRRLDRYQALAERLMIGDTAGDLADIAKREPVVSLLNSASTRMSRLGIDPMQADIEAHYRWIEGVSTRTTKSLDELAAMGIAPPRSEVIDYETPKKRSVSDRIDAVLIHKVWGLAIFALIMATLFVTIFWLAAPIMDGISAGIDALGGWVAAHLSDGPIKDLITDGIFKGVGAVVVFVPQIALLFFFLAILEDSGYLARAAFLMDRLLAKVGLHGKSFIPLLSSFACAIPGIMATRTIENRKDRLATILVAPFMSCSARLPVYTLLIGTFFAAYGAITQAGIMLACYALGIIAAAGMAWIFKRSLMKGAPSSFILELPTYKLPQASQVARHVFTNTLAFLTKAGTTIFCLSVILWAMTYYPRLSPTRQAEIRATAVSSQSQSRADIEKAKQQILLDHPSLQQVHLDAEDELDAEIQRSVASEQLRYSIAGRMGHVLEPVIHPLGYDWKMGIGLVGAFAAREVFVSTMAITYGAGSEDETQPLEQAMQNDRYANGKPVWTPLVAISLLVWFVLAMQCMSTLAIVKRETGGWKWPLFMLAYMNVLAYVVALGVYQVGRIWFT